MSSHKQIRAVLSLTTIVALIPRAASAQSHEPAAPDASARFLLARGQLQQGFTLKEQGKCNEAIPHFVESIQLDRQPKALLNLADCEEKLGRLGPAAKHFLEARDLANAQGVQNQATYAAQRLQSIEQRMPKLVIKLAPGVPPDTVVARDGVDLGPASLGTPLPIEAGKHTIVARGGGLQRDYEVTVAQSGNTDVIVTPIGGRAMTAPQGGTPPRAAAPGAPVPVPSGGAGAIGIGSSSATEGSNGNIQRIGGVVLIGTGAVGLAVGSVFGLKVQSKNAEIRETCPEGTFCSPDEMLQYYSAVSDAKAARTISYIGFGVGAAFVTAGVISLLTAPKGRGGTGRLWFQPTVGVGVAGAEVGGDW